MFDPKNPTSIDVVARTIWGEARGSGLEGMAAVANVIGNRVNADIGRDNKPDWWGEGYIAVCLKPWQFSCWNENDPNYAKLMAVELPDPQFSDAIVFAWAQTNGRLRDRTKGSDSYYAAGMKNPPAWARGKVYQVEIGGHLFYKTI